MLKLYDIFCIQCEIYPAQKLFTTTQCCELGKSLKIAFTNEMCMMKKFIYISSAPSYEFMREDDGCYFLFQERLLVPKGLMQQNFL